MKKNPWVTLVVVILIFVVLIRYLTKNENWHSESHLQAQKNYVLLLPVEGILLDSTQVVKKLRKYKKEESIKAVVLQVNSPGGVVGPSQEIFSAIKHFKEYTKKPVVVASSSVNASGAYYLSVAADKIVVNPGTMMGSIGVIMEFANLEKLYDWAKVSRFSLTSGQFKDSGSEYRTMRDDEKALFQTMISEVYQQFRKTVKVERHLSDAVMDQYADGRVFTGEFAVQNGFADQLGNLEEAIELAAELASIKDSYEIFEPPKPRPDLIDYFMDRNEDSDWEGKLNQVTQKVLKLNLISKPLYLMPGAWE